MRISGGEKRRGVGRAKRRFDGHDVHGVRTFRWQAWALGRVECSRFLINLERWKVQKEANREGAFDGCFSLAEGLPVWMDGGESADDERYSDDGEMREERVRKFRKGPADDD